MFFFKQKTEYEIRISDWSSDVCSSDLDGFLHGDMLAGAARQVEVGEPLAGHHAGGDLGDRQAARLGHEGHRAAGAGVDLEDIDVVAAHRELRSDERRVGKEYVRTSGSRCAPYN